MNIIKGFISFGSTEYYVFCKLIQVNFGVLACSYSEWAWTWCRNPAKLWALKKTIKMKSNYEKLKLSYLLGADLIYKVTTEQGVFCCSARNCYPESWLESTIPWLLYIVCNFAKYCAHIVVTTVTATHLLFCITGFWRLYIFTDYSYPRIFYRSWEFVN